MPANGNRSLDEVLSFFRAFLEAEHVAWVACNIEPKNERYRRIEAVAQQFLARDLNVKLGFGRSFEDQEVTDEDRTRVAKLQPRPIFLVEEYRSPAFGTVWVSYCGRPEKFLGRNWVRLDVASERDGRLQLIAQYVLAFEPGLTLHTGTEVRPFGARNRAKKLREPAKSDQREYFAGLPTSA